MRSDTLLFDGALSQADPMALIQMVTFKGIQRDREDKNCFVARHFALDAAAADKLAVEVLPVEDLRAINAANPLPDHALAPGTLPQFQARQPDANRRILVRTARAAA
jgi:hypothetical protein